MFRPAGTADLTGMWHPRPFSLFLATGAICSAAGLLLSQGPGKAAEVEDPAPNSSATPTQSVAVETVVAPFVTQVTPPSETAREIVTGAPATPEVTAMVETPVVTVAEEVATPTPSAFEEREELEPAPVSTVATLPEVHQATVVESLPAKAQGLLASMNAARVAEGLSPLEVDETLVAVALSRAQDLVKNDYFAHYGPDGGSAFSELAARGVSYALAGENLARNNYLESKTVAAAFEGLMASPGHRANILEPRFTKVGVVAVLDGRMWVYVTVFMS